MKRIMALLIIVVLLFSISACSQTYGEQMFIDKESELISYSILSEEIQSQIKKDYVAYLKSTCPDNEAIQKLTSKEIMLMDFSGEHDGIRLVIIDWYGNTHADEMTLIEVAGLSLEVSSDYKEMLKFYKNGEFKTVEQAYKDGWFDEKTVENFSQLSTWGYSQWNNFIDGKICVGLTVDATENYIDYSTEVLSEKFDIEIISSEKSYKMKDLDDPKGREYQVIALYVPQHGKRELYSVLHILSKHKDVRFADLDHYIYTE